MSLESFLQKFNNAGSDSYSLDPYKNFKISFDFNPNTGSKILQYIRDLKIDNNDSSPVIDFSDFVQRVTIPEPANDIDNADTIIGTFPVVKNLLVSPNSKELTLTILNTKEPVFESIFYPWMQEVSQPVWSYSDVPYTTVKIIIDLQPHSNFSYVFLGCCPISFTTIQPTHEQDESITRDVRFKFDFMCFKNNKKKNNATANG